MALDTSELMFGVELEQFPSCDREDEEETCDTCGGEGGYEQEEFEYDENGVEIDCRVEWTECDECDGRGYFYREAYGNNDDPDTALRVMRRLRLTTHDYLHPYHCDCNACAPFRSTPLLAAQEDCTVGIEWVSRAMRSPNNLNRIVEGHAEVMMQTRWRPDGYDTCGNHIHIGLPRAMRNASNAPDLTRLALNFIGAVLVEKDWESLADGGCRHGIRPYNVKGGIIGRDSRQKTETAYNGTWLDLKKFGRTFEFRLWNTPRDEWRIIAHAGMSMALTRWGIARAEATIDDENHKLPDIVAEAKEMSLLAAIDEWLPARWPQRDETLALVQLSGQ